LGDCFYENQLKSNNLKEAVDGSAGKINLNLRLHEGYDHSYYFISTFMPEHMDFHAGFLNK
jgi:S-formylglutathione hydrolase